VLRATPVALERLRRHAGRTVGVALGPLDLAFTVQTTGELLPALGKYVAKDEAAYRYLAESIRMHPDQETLKVMMEQAGLARVEYFNMTAGVVALHRGYRL